MMVLKRGLGYIQIMAMIMEIYEYNKNYQKRKYTMKRQLTRFHTVLISGETIQHHILNHSMTVFFVLRWWKNVYLTILSLCKSSLQTNMQRQTGDVSSIMIFDKDEITKSMSGKQRY